MTECIELLYEELLKFDLTYKQMYEMTVYELKKTLEARKEGLSYKLWKLGNLSQPMKKYPETPDEASPELAKPKKKYAMPNFLKEKWARQKGYINE